MNPKLLDDFNLRTHFIANNAHNDKHLEFQRGSIGFGDSINDVTLFTQMSNISADFNL
jgi:hypothetical protein